MNPSRIQALLECLW